MRHPSVCGPSSKFASRSIAISQAFINNRIRVTLLFICCCILLVTTAHGQQLHQSIKSPDGHIQMELSNAQNQLQYNINYDGQQLASGNIGFVLGENNTYGLSVKSIDLLASHKKQKRTLSTRGNHTSARILKNNFQFKITSMDGKSDFWLAVKLYDNGIAYRYTVEPGEQALTRTVGHITLPATTKLWWQSDVHTYEANYHSATYNALGDSLNMGMPLTLLYPNGVYAALTEADIFGFAGSHFTYYKGEPSLNYTLAGKVHPKGEEKLQSGWEIMTVAKSLNGLVNNDIIRDVSQDPDKSLYPRGLNTDWIQSGKSIWTWMSKKRDVTPDNIKLFTDYAANMNIPYNLIDDGWVRWKAEGKDHWQILKEQVDYAKTKGVGIWVWQAYPPHNGTPGLIDSNYMRSFFEKCAALGVKGMKIDFINAETQDKIAFYQRAASMAAHYHLMVDFHGANKGTGMEYTYPNLLSQEGIRGLEQEDNKHWPYLNTVLPFTRYLAGPADYTPLSFQPYVSSTTLAHQVATVAVFTSPFLCLGVDPQDLSQSIALPFVQQIPADWDETIVLPSSKIGEIAAYARRKGNNWYLAILNGSNPRTLYINLSFLGRKKYTLVALENELNSRATKVIKMDKASKHTSLEVKLPAGGGYLGIFKR